MGGWPAEVSHSTLSKLRALKRRMLLAHVLQQCLQPVQQGQRQRALLFSVGGSYLTQPHSELLSGQAKAYPTFAQKLCRIEKTN